MYSAMTPAPCNHLLAQEWRQRGGTAATACKSARKPAASLGMTLGAIMTHLLGYLGGCAVQEQQEHQAIIFKVYAKRAAALQLTAFLTWRSSAAMAHERRATLRALTLRSRHRRLQAALDKYVFCTHAYSNLCCMIDLLAP